MAARDFDYDLFTIGAGSGGTRASRVAAAHGARVAVAEEHRVGGTCVIRGCVPKKLLIYGAHFAEDLKDAHRFGWNVPRCDFTWSTLRDNVLAEVDRLNAAYISTLETHGVEIINERATVTGPHSVRTASGTEITARVILIAVGAQPVVPELQGREHGITSNEAFHLHTLPKRVLIAGAGYIANEFAGIFNELGAKVTLLNRSETLLRGYDAEITGRLMSIAAGKGIDFRMSAQIERIGTDDAGGVEVHIAGSRESIAVDQVMFALGRMPMTGGLGLASAGVELDHNGAIKVDEDYRSSCDSVYAIGDVTNRIQLTPVAIREGQAFADTMFGNSPSRVNYSNIPSAVFSHPPLAAVGMTEDQAKKAFSHVSVYTSDFRPMKNVLAGRHERALYKMVCDGETDRIVGLHMIGPDAPEILQAAAVAVRAGLTKADFDATIALHPTMAEELVLMRRAPR